jgi:hypothetical protein
LPFPRSSRAVILGQFSSFHFVSSTLYLINIYILFKYIIIKVKGRREGEKKKVRANARDFQLSSENENEIVEENTGES